LVYRSASGASSETVQMDGIELDGIIGWNGFFSFMFYVTFHLLGRWLMQ